MWLSLAVTNVWLGIALVLQLPPPLLACHADVDVCRVRESVAAVSRSVWTLRGISGANVFASDPGGGRDGRAGPVRVSGVVGFVRSPLVEYGEGRGYRSGHVHGLSYPGEDRHPRRSPPPA